MVILLCERTKRKGNKLIMSNDNRRNNFPRDGRGVRGDHGKRDQKNKYTFQSKKTF